MLDAAVLKQIENELIQAETARQAGFEGRARVSARRAAGLAIRAYWISRQVTVGPASAYDLLERMSRDPDTSPEVLEVLEHLLARVNVQFQLPMPVDLIAETRWLVQTLNKDETHGKQLI